MVKAERHDSTTDGELTFEAVQANGARWWLASFPLNHAWWCLMHYAIQQRLQPSTRFAKMRRELGGVLGILVGIVARQARAVMVADGPWGEDHLKPHPFDPAFDLGLLSPVGC